MNRTPKTLLILAIWTIAIPVTLAEELFVAADGDTFIWQKEPATSHDYEDLQFDKSMWVGDEQGLQIALIHFDKTSLPSPAQYGIAKAELLVKKNSYSQVNGIPVTVLIKQILGSWTEQVTWATKPAIGSTIYKSWQIDVNQDTHTYDVTNLIKAVSTSNDPFHGIALVPGGDPEWRTVSYSQHEGGATGPRLKITVLSLIHI